MLGVATSAGGKGGSLKAALLAAAASPPPPAGLASIASSCRKTVNDTCSAHNSNTPHSNRAPAFMRRMVE